MFKYCLPQFCVSGFDEQLKTQSMFLHSTRHLFNRNWLTLPTKFNSWFTSFDTALVRRQIDMCRPAVWTCAGACRRACSVSGQSEDIRKAMLSHQRMPPERTRLARGTFVSPSLRSAMHLEGSWKSPCIASLNLWCGFLYFLEIDSAQDRWQTCWSGGSSSWIGLSRDRLFRPWDRLARLVHVCRRYRMMLATLLPDACWVCRDFRMPPAILHNTTWCVPVVGRSWRRRSVADAQQTLSYHNQSVRLRYTWMGVASECPCLLDTNNNKPTQCVITITTTNSYDKKC